MAHNLFSIGQKLKEMKFDVLIIKIRLHIILKLIGCNFPISQTHRLIGNSST